MKLFRGLILLVGLFMLLLALGFVFRTSFVIRFWPWPDGRYSYLFIGSIFAAISAAAFWIGWKGEFGALPAGSLNLLVIASLTTIYFFWLAFRDGRSNLFPFAIASLVAAIVSSGVFLWSSQISLSDSRSTPALVRISFVIFTISLLLAGTALILRAPIFPWELNPDSSVIFGCIFLGDAFYFLHGLLRPRWHNALGQLLSFLAYDLVLIGPFLSLLNTVEPGRLLNLIVYVAVLIYSGLLAVCFLFFDPTTRFGS